MYFCLNYIQHWAFGLTLVLLAVSYQGAGGRFTESQNGRGWKGPLWVS